MIEGRPLNINSYQPIVTGKTNKGTDISSKKVVTQEFDKFLKEALDSSKVKFSGHAKQRLSSRNVELDKDKVERLNNAVEKAQEKGAKETLVLLDDMAMVVSVKNNTVITVMTGETIKDNVFTNIDSAVMA